MGASEIAAGVKVKSSHFDELRTLVGAWTSYAPTWTASTTNPAIGNGTLTGAYLQVGKLVHYVGRVFAGSTTTYGSGTYNISLPVTALDADLGIGSALVYDSSVATARYAATTVFNGTNAIVFYANNALVSAIAPFTWANGDRLMWHIAYEAA